MVEWSRAIVARFPQTVDGCQVRGKTKMMRTKIYTHRDHAKSDKKYICVMEFGERTIRGVNFFLDIVSMILPQVHLRKPCYDFSFLEMFRFKQLRDTRSPGKARVIGPLRKFHRNIHR